jgi:hypothetical protein
MTAPNLLELFGQADLYRWGSDTLLASREEYARRAAGAAAVTIPAPPPQRWNAVPAVGR